jgi:hypothetical protein
MKKIKYTSKDYFYLSLGNSTIDKLEFSQKNTKKNPDDKKTTPVSDPERLLKPKGYLKSITPSTGKIYQPKFAQVNAKVLVEELTPEENFKQASSAEASTSKSEARFEKSEIIVPKMQIEIESTDALNSRKKISLSIPPVVNTLSTPSFLEVKFSVL